MKLIATLGATKVTNKHIYKIENYEYSEYFSFLALQKHYNISNEKVYILGTKKTKETLGNYIQNFNFIKLQDNNLEEIFQKSVELVDDEDILDLTQSFRLLSFGVFLGVNFLNKKLKVFYAQLQKSDCKYSSEECKHNFIPLDKYLQIGSLAREINTFVSSWYVIENEIENFFVIHNKLNIISKKLLVNDVDIKEDLLSAKKNIKILKKDKFVYLNTHLDILDKELTKIELALLNPKDSIKFFRMSELYFQKNLLLQTLTMLFEAISAYLGDIVPKNYKCKKYDKFLTLQDGKYKFRNCVKNSLRFPKSCKKWWFKNLKDCEKFRENLLKIDIMRNNSAHAFIQGKALEDYKNEIKNLLLFFKGYINGNDKTYN